MELNTEEIKKVMKKKGISTTELAYKMGKKESFVYAILSGKHGKTFDTLESVATALDVSELSIVK